MDLTFDYKIQHLKNVPAIIPPIRGIEGGDPMDLWVGVYLKVSLRTIGHVKLGRRWLDLDEVVAWYCSARNRSTFRLSNQNTTVSRNSNSGQLAKTKTGGLTS
jgi:hypothetical protein